MKVKATINISSYDESTPVSSQAEWRKMLERADLNKLAYWHIDARRQVHDAEAGKLSFDERGAWLELRLPLWALSNAGAAMMSGSSEASMVMRAVVLTARGNQFLKQVVCGMSLEKMS